MVEVGDVQQQFNFLVGRLGVDLPASEALRNFSKPGTGGTIIMATSTW